ncbi:uncharacterized protein LOC117298290 [Asterias rubens]|uniref:uncharacterized protein LOC117298290 n=1 Tax=Asterias rubens TaxID=7604 RepID=UPI00145518C5|nr:uncharacterized protein LOC117298290 [Asterias rubens]
MTPLISRLLVVMLVVLGTGARKPFIPGKAKPAPATTQESRAMDTNIVDFERRMAEVEKSTSVMKQEMVEVVSENRELKERLGGMTTTMAELHTAHQRVQELERILKKFENFFGVLYSELPDVFAREITIEKRLSSLNEYIGNRESELVALRTPPTVKAEPGENPVDEELLGAAMRQLSTENSNMKFRMESMERMMSEPSKDRLTSGGSFNGGAMDDETAERLERLERLVALQLAPQLDDDDEDQNPMQRMSPGGATSSSRLALSESDTEILRDELNSVRSLSSTRKSLFSAGATRHLTGQTGVYQTVVFDNVFANKGNHFKEHNSTFVCHINGYYFFSFTVRSYDHKYMGVTLLKNGNRVTGIGGEPGERNQMMSQSLVLQLQQGDQVHLVLTPSDAYAIYSDHGKYCTFTGFLIYKGS